MHVKRTYVPDRSFYVWTGFLDDVGVAVNQKRYSKQCGDYRRGLRRDRILCARLLAQLRRGEITEVEALDRSGIHDVGSFNELAAVGEKIESRTMRDLINLGNWRAMRGYFRRPIDEG